MPEVAMSDGLRRFAAPFAKANKDSLLHLPVLGPAIAWPKRKMG
jgi:hypothetical protein